MPCLDAVAASSKRLLVTCLHPHQAVVHAAGAAQFSSGVPDQMHRYVALYCAVLFLVAIAAPMEQSNNAAMYAEVSQNDLFWLLLFALAVDACRPNSVTKCMWCNEVSCSCQCGRFSVHYDPCNSQKSSRVPSQPSVITTPLCGCRMPA